MRRGWLSRVGRVLGLSATHAAATLALAQTGSGGQANPAAPAADSFVPGVALAQASPDGAGGADGLSKLEREARAAVQATLVTDLSHAAPGRSGMLAVQFKIAPKWHLYWRNAGDTGLPIGFEWTVPAGVKIGEALWPVPQRHPAPGDILDYIYEDQATLLFPFTIDSATAATNLDIKVKLDWLVCKEACVPGGTTLSLTLSPAPGSESGERSRGPGAPVIDAARAALPLASTDAKGPAVESSWAGTELRLHVPGAERLVFLPYESDDAVALNLLEQGDRAGTQLVVRYASTVRSAGMVRALLGVQMAGKLTYRVLELEGPGVDPPR